MLNDEKVKIKLNTCWCRDLPDMDFSERFICLGIWITNGLEIAEGKQKIFTLTCVSANCDEVKIGDKRRMYESTIISFCHEVKLIHLPKIEE